MFANLSQGARKCNFFGKSFSNSNHFTDYHLKQSTNSIILLQNSLIQTHPACTEGSVLAIYKLLLVAYYLYCDPFPSYPSAICKKVEFLPPNCNLWLFSFSFQSHPCKHFHSIFNMWAELENFAQLFRWSRQILWGSFEMAARRIQEWNEFTLAYHILWEVEWPYPAIFAF